ncbi:MULTISPECIES: hypothetical protein [unclassified Polaromonas]|nr:MULTISPECIES: hypothetical protein [unclassified Polaromonas]
METMPAELPNGMIWQDTRLRSMEPADAAALWLAPVAPAQPSA